MNILSDSLLNYEDIKQSADYIKGNTSQRPKIGIICGTGLGNLANQLRNTVAIEYTNIPHFPVSTVIGHAGRLLIGQLGEIWVMVMQGRFHYYEGYSLQTCAMPVLVMKQCGVEYLIATNAAGGINPAYEVGDIMLMKDHLNLMGIAGISVLRGPNDERLGPRFVGMAGAYEKSLIQKALQIGQQLGHASNLHTGVYTCVGGPTFETTAEVKMLKNYGVDAVGMSTVHEAIMARYSGMKVFGFSLITNKCSSSDDSDEEVEHDSVLQVGRDREALCYELVSGVVRFIDEQQKQK